MVGMGIEGISYGVFTILQVIDSARLESNELIYSIGEELYKSYYFHSNPILCINR